MKVYYWATRKNFGDLLAPKILEHFCQVTTEWTDPLFADIISTGSVLDVMPNGFSGMVAGSGALRATIHTDLTHATVLGLRGHLTAERVQLARGANPVLGDPGLLVSEMVQPERGKYRLSVVPHWSDKDLFARELQRSKRYRYSEPHLIDPSGDPLKVVTEIGSSDKIITSSLHGAISADSFGIPRRVERFASMSNPYEGYPDADYKYRDYASVLGQDIEWGILQAAPRVRVEQLQFQLFDMLEEVASYTYA